MKTVHGWAFPDADTFMAKELKADGTYQASHFRMALEHVTDRSVAIDGGAHVGCWTRLMAATFQRVIAVEPSVDTFEALQANMLRFAVQNALLLNIALGSTAGLVSMALDDRNTARANTGARYAMPGGSIPCHAIDEWNLPQLGFLKLDIEGSEVAALEGAAETLMRCQPIVLWENKQFWTRYGLKADAPQTLLSTLGYHHLATAGRDEIWGPAS